MTRSECTAPVNSGRPISVANAVGTVAYIATYTDKVVTMSATDALSFARSHLPRNNPAQQSPGDGAFYLTQTDCGCCKCRAVYVFGDQTFDSVPGTVNGNQPTCGALVLPVTIHITVQHIDEDGNPDGDPDTSETETVFLLQLWERLAAPCRSPGGPSGRNPDGTDAGPAIAILWMPGEPLSIDDDRNPDPDQGESITTTASGSYGAILDQTGTHPLPGFQPIVFTLPEPCSDSQSFSASLNKVWSLSDITANATMTFSLAMA